MLPSIERDAVNKRTVSMWDECGMRFRSNIVELGGTIELHAHTYAHHAAVWGPFEIVVRALDGSKSILTRSTGMLLIPAYFAHSFKYLGAELGQVLCFWPIGFDGASK